MSAETTTETKPGILQRAWGRCFAALYDPVFWRAERAGNAARQGEAARLGPGLQWSSSVPAPG